ncbi:MAG: hypothetical protein JWN42_2183 [Candidatus Angelobacter sp.]|nr:hypothetical protein [Candidatus Angelobacter sp.]
MNNVYTIVLALSSILLCNKAGEAQDALAVKKLEITVQAIDGRNGKDLAHQRLLIFTGRSSDDVKTHAAHVELTTDKKGMGTLSLDASKALWIQPWADGRTLCQQVPNQNSFSVDEIISKGLATPNTCSSVVKESAPGRLIIFARPATLMEKMKR